MFFVVRAVSRLQSHNGVQAPVTNQPERTVRYGRALELALTVQKLSYPYFMHIHLGYWIASARHQHTFH